MPTGLSYDEVVEQRNFVGNIVNVDLYIAINTENIEEIKDNLIASLEQVDISNCDLKVHCVDSEKLGSIKRIVTNTYYKIEAYKDINEDTDLILRKREGIVEIKNK